MVFDFDQYNRPIWIYYVYIAAYLFLTLIGLHYVYFNKIYSDKSKIRPILFITLFTVFAIFYCINSDYFRYRSYVQYVAEGIYTSHRSEQVYYKIAAYVKGDFELFRLIIWGGAIILTALSSKLLKVPVYMALLIWFVLFYDIVCYARASLAMAILYAGVTLILVSKKSRISLVYIFLGLVLCYFSVSFHKSLIIATMSVPIIFIKLKRNTLFVYAIFLILGCVFLVNVIKYDPTLLLDDYVDEFIKGNQAIASGRWELNSLKNYVSSALGYGLFYLPLAVGFFKIMNRKIVINFIIVRLYWVTFTVALIATSFWFFFGFNNIYFYRVLYMTAAPIAIITAYMYHKRIIGKFFVVFLFIYSVVYHLLFLYTTITTHNIH